MSVLSKKERDLLTSPCIRICEPVTGEKFIEIRQSSDFLVHAESFDSENKKVTMLSISTKIPEYLSSNRCIVAIGPSEIASINLIKENDLGIVLSDYVTLEQNAQILAATIANIEIYNGYCERAAQYFINHFDADKMRHILKTKLSQF